MEDEWREAFATTLFGVVNIQEKSRLHSVCTQGSGWPQGLRAEVRADPHRSCGSSLTLEELLEILRILPRYREVGRGLIGACRYSGPVCNGCALETGPVEPRLREG